MKSLCILLALATLAPAQTKPLRATFIDVEGGQSTLFVTPLGESLLIDAGWPGHEARDANRIATAAKKLGRTRIDYVLITHFHDDHVGGVAQLVQQIPIGTFIDHGEYREKTDKVAALYAAYQKVIADTHAHHLIAKPGDILPIKGMDATILSADGNLIPNRDLVPRATATSSLPNPLCASTPAPPADTTENSRSLGIKITFGSFSLLDLGDLTSDKEYDLVCPTNRIGTVDLLVVSHHGWYQSSSPIFLHALHPRVAIMDNGETKGGSIPVLDTMLHSPGLEDLYQLHYSAEGAATHNTKPENIANPQGPDAAHPIELAAQPNGAFTVTNPRTATTTTYRK